MKVAISQELLSSTLSTVIKAVAARSINPVLGHVRIVADADSLTLTATDGEFTIRRRAAVSGSTPGSTLAPARLLSDLVARLPKQEITLSVEGSTLNISTGRSHYDLACLGDENFPELPEFNKAGSRHLPPIAISCALLKRAILQTAFAGVKESSTGLVHYTNGLFLAFKSGRLDVVATDGHRLALRRNDGLGGAGSTEADLLLPIRVAEELERMLPDAEDTACELFHLGSQAVFRFGSLLVLTALLDVKFPPYESVIPREIESRAHLRKDELSDALGRVELLNRQKDQNPIAMLQTDEKLVGSTMRISSEAGEVGKGSEEIGCELSGPDVKVRVNPRYLTEALKAVGGEQVTLNWVSQVNPIMLTSPREPDWIYIVMPIRMD